MPVVSVIIPVYDIEKYVCRCIESVISQTFRDIEILLVDDGSLDNSGGICDEYASRDERIRVLHKENGGLSSARNAGLDKAIGDYIMFVDGDDWIDPNTIEICVNAARKTNADIVQFDYKTVQEKDISNELDGIAYADNIEASLLERDLALHSMYVTVWNKLYNKTLWQNLRFDEGRLHEDDFLFHRLMYLVHRVALVKQRLYYYLQRTDSIMHALTQKNYTDAADAFFDRVRFCAENGWEEGAKHGSTWGSSYFLSVYKEQLIDVDRVFQKKTMREFLHILKKTHTKLDFKSRIYLRWPDLY